ncbi:MAG: Druantia anti-phage system protein DruA [Luteolibacter sp.]
MKIDAIATDCLGRVRLRLLEPHERERFDLLLETRHYLKSSRIGGRHLRYVAEVDGEWVALLTFSGAAPKLKGREKWLGWSPRQQALRSLTTSSANTAAPRP